VQSPAPAQSPTPAPFTAESEPSTIPPSPLDSVISDDDIVSSQCYSTDSFFGDDLDPISLDDLVFDGIPFPDDITVPDDAFDGLCMF
jgi:hypothetical protein